MKARYRERAHDVVHGDVLSRSVHLRENGGENCRASEVAIRETWIHNIEGTSFRLSVFEISRQNAAKSWWVIRQWVRIVRNLFRNPLSVE